MLDLSTALSRSARCFPERTAIVFNSTKYSYRELDALSNKVANSLIEGGLNKGDCVALSCPNLPYFPIIYYGILKAGGVVAPLNVLLKPREIRYHLEDSKAKFYFCFEGTPQLPMAQQAIEALSNMSNAPELCIMTADISQTSYQGINTLGTLFATQSSLEYDFPTKHGDDTAVVLYTSGTTGHPKGSELTHSNMLSNAFVANDILSGSPEDRHIVALPLFHSFGQTIHMNASILAGSTLILVPQFTPQAVLTLIHDHQATIFAGVPTMYIAMLSTDIETDVSSLRIAISGGSSLNQQVLTDFERTFNVDILEGYGLSETSPVASFNYPYSKKVGSIGLPVLGTEISIMDEQEQHLPNGERGEIVIRGHNVMKGYLNQPEETAKTIRNGWLHTGDVGYFDDEGHLFIVDRLKEVIIRGGFNVYPREVEEVFMSHGDVSMVAVIGIPDKHYGEEIKAFVTLKPEATISATELVEWGKQQCAAYKYPRYVEVLDQMPMTATGKILKKELKTLS